MQFSKFAKIKKVRNNVYAIFNTLLMDVLYISEEELSKLKNFSFDNNSKEQYLNAGIIVENEEKDQKAIQSVRRQCKLLEKEINVLYLILSSGCNLACRYCFLENSMYNNHCELNMPMDVIDAAVNKYCDYIEKNKITRPLIIFYGGEPLVNWNGIERTISIVNSRKIKMEYSIVTNATLLDEAKIKFLADNDVEIGISIDGPKFLNDKNRIYRNSNRSVYDSVTEKIKLLKKYKAKFGLSMTVSQDLLDNKEQVIEWIKQYGVNDIFYNLYHFTSKEEWESYYTEACEFLIYSYETLFPFGINDGRIQRKIDSFFNGSFKFADCASIGANQLTVKPNGDLCVCQGYHKSDKYVLGNIKDLEFDEITNSEEFEFWANRIPIKNERCIDCEAIFICGGGCAMQAEALFDSRKELDIPFCNHTKTAFDWLIQKGYELTFENKNITKGEKNND